MEVVRRGGSLIDPGDGNSPLQTHGTSETDRRGISATTPDLTDPIMMVHALRGDLDSLRGSLTLANREKERLGRANNELIQKHKMIENQFSVKVAHLEEECESLRREVEHERKLKLEHQDTARIALEDQERQINESKELRSTFDERLKKLMQHLDDRGEQIQNLEKIKIDLSLSGRIRC